MEYQKGRDFPGRMGGTGKKAKPNTGDKLVKRSTDEIKAMTDRVMGHPMKTGMNNPA